MVGTLRSPQPLSRAHCPNTSGASRGPGLAEKLGTSEAAWPPCQADMQNPLTNHSPWKDSLVRLRAMSKGKQQPGWGSSPGSQPWPCACPVLVFPSPASSLGTRRCYRLERKVFLPPQANLSAPRVCPWGALPDCTVGFLHYPGVVPPPSTLWPYPEQKGSSPGSRALWQEETRPSENQTKGVVPGPRNPTCPVQALNSARGLQGLLCP